MEGNCKFELPALEHRRGSETLSMKNGRTKKKVIRVCCRVRETPELCPINIKNLIYR